HHPARDARCPPRPQEDRAVAGATAGGRFVNDSAAAKIPRLDRSALSVGWLHEESDAMRYWLVALTPK
ncbi:MAG: hypothetical protein ACRDIB_17935, partial [Ardenticatenaceae bacterium]